MKNRQKITECLAGILGFAGVLTGAIAAHKAQDGYAEGLLRQASFYQLMHCLAIFLLAARTEWAAIAANLCFFMGIFLFCGGLCLKAFMGVTVFGPLVPVGGACLMLGWLCLAVAGFTRKSP